jgi:hypothetical protein
MAELILKEEVYQIVGAAMDVYYQLGCGFLEPVYQQALEIELDENTEPQQEVLICYKGQILKRNTSLTSSALDKSSSISTPRPWREVAQLLNYMNAGNAG